TAYKCSGDLSKTRESSPAAIPAKPSTANACPSYRFAKSVNRKNPTASPANANALHGKIGKSHGCGALKICTPFTYDSSGHGKTFGRNVVHSGGVTIATNVAAQSAPAIPLLRANATDSLDVK